MGVVAEIERRDGQMIGMSKQSLCRDRAGDGGDDDGCEIRDRVASDDEFERVSSASKRRAEGSCDASSCSGANQHAHIVAAAVE